MIDYVAKNLPPKVMLLTECSMSDNVSAQHPSSTSYDRATCAPT